MRIEYMREFLVFSRYLNVTHAANELNVSQPVLSGHLASIENELGVRLIDRKDGMSLTPEGVLFLEGAESLINDYEDLVKRCKEAVSLKPGKLIFEKPVTSISMERAINSLISEFKADNGNAVVKMHVTTNKDLYRSLEDGDVDIGFVWGGAPIGMTTRMLREVFATLQFLRGFVSVNTFGFQRTIRLRQKA